MGEGKFNSYLHLANSDAQTIGHAKEDVHDLLKNLPSHKGHVYCCFCSGLCGDDQGIVINQAMVVCGGCGEQLIRAAGYVMGLNLKTPANTDNGIASLGAYQVDQIWAELKGNFLAGLIHGLEAYRLNSLSAAYGSAREAKKHVAHLKQEIETRKKNPIGFVYLLLRDDGCYKIGKSNNPIRRLPEIQRDFPSAMIAHTFKSKQYSQAEDALHAKFDPLRKDGEWFLLAPEDVEYIRAIRNYADGFFSLTEAYQQHNNEKGLTEE